MTRIMSKGLRSRLVQVPAVMGGIPAKSLLQKSHMYFPGSVINVDPYFMFVSG